MRARTEGINGRNKSEIPGTGRGIFGNVDLPTFMVLHPNRHLLGRRSLVFPVVVGLKWQRDGIFTGNVNVNEMAMVALRTAKVTLLFHYCWGSQEV